MAHGLALGVLEDDAALIVSGLSTNAIRHTASGSDSDIFRLAVAVSAQVVAVSVTDDGSTGTAPKVEHQDHEAEHGRGLGMVSLIAHRVVVHSSDQGHTVTAELYADARLGGARAETGLLVECWTEDLAERQPSALLASFDAYSARQADRWVSVALRTISPALDADASDEAW